jgi:23S rRNA (cytidine2498-2'-O)-methyltransferase
VYLGEGRPKDARGVFVPLVFVERVMRTNARRYPAEPDTLGRAIFLALKAGGLDRPRPWTLEVHVTGARNPRDPRRREARKLAEALKPDLLRRLPESWAELFRDPPSEVDRIAEVWLLPEGDALLGYTRTEDGVSEDSAPKAKAKLPRGEERLEQALAFAGVAPEKGEGCVLFEGGRTMWAEALERRGAKVLAVASTFENKKLGPRLLTVGANPFEYYPEDTIDWLFCDLTRRPLEVTKLVAKWGRKVWARQVLIALKLPMKEKSAFLREADALLSAAGWTNIRTRQVSADKDEVIVHAYLEPKLAQRGWQAPFGFDRQLREAASSRKRKHERRAQKKSPLRNIHKSHKKPTKAGSR